MKVLLTIGSLGGGGAEKVMLWLAEWLAGNGHEVILVTQMADDENRYAVSDRITHVSLGGMVSFKALGKFSAIINMARWTWLLWRVAARRRPDVVLSFIDSMNISVLQSFYLSRLPVVVAERTDPATGPITAWRKRMRPGLYRRRAAAVVFQTRSIEARFAQEWNLTRTAVIPNAVTRRFAEAPERTGERVVVSVGRLDPLKGHDILLEAWARLGAARAGWRLRILGEGPLRPQYEAMVARLGLGDSVELPGFTSDVLPDLLGAAVGVLPSRVEGFPNALIEMMAVGLPVVASDLPPACPEVVTHEQDGLLYDGTSAEALAEALARLMADADLRAALGTAAMTVRARYSEAACLQMWADCLQGAVRCG